MDNSEAANAAHDARIANLIVFALIRALHQTGVLNAQAVAEQLDHRALLPPRNGRDPRIDAAAAMAVRAVQAEADRLQLLRPHPPDTAAD